MDAVTTYISSSFSWKDVLQSTGSATKASVSVILVLLYGFLSRRYDFLTQETEDVSEATLQEGHWVALTFCRFV